jgi:septal ring factor EnvC (AmiA/AmiB activator)
VSLAALGAFAGIFSTIAATFVTLWAQKISSRSKENEKELDRNRADLETQQFGQTVLKDGIQFSEQKNKQLRLDLLEAEAEIAKLRVDLRAAQREVAALREEVRVNEVECKHRLKALAAEIQKLRGHSD